MAVHHAPARQNSPRDLPRAAGLYADREADILFATTQGLVDPALIGHRTPEPVVAPIGHHLNHLFTTP